MQLIRCTQGLCLVSFLLLSSALILDDMAIILAGGTLVAAILGQYLIFERHLQAIVSSIEIRRDLNRNPVRKGTPLQVTTEVSLTGIAGMSVQISDLPPSNTAMVEGSALITTGPDPAHRSYECRYRIIPLVHGEQHFSGVSVNIRNLFFETTVLMKRAPDCRPVLSVLPTGYFAVPSSDAAEGSRDHRKASVWSGIDVHSLREYIPGDDLRHADWKVSAKYDKIFIRKYTAPLSHPPLIIVDLPWIGAPYPEKEFGRMVSEVTGMAKHTLQNFQYVSVLIISGPNVLHLIREEKNHSRCIAEIQEWMNPHERPVHFYRMPDRSDLRAQVRASEFALGETTDPLTQKFLESLHNRYTKILQHQRNPAFSGQVARAISQVIMTEAYLFTLACGDTSHIQHVVRPLKTQKVRVFMKIIDSSHTRNYGTPDLPSGTPGVQP